MKPRRRMRWAAFHTEIDMSVGVSAVVGGLIGLAIGAGISIWRVEPLASPGR